MIRVFQSCLFQPLLCSLFVSQPLFSLPLVHAMSGVNACCQRHSIGRLPARAIRSYAVQNSTDICRINAVIFYTHRGKMFCADPNQKWVQLYLTVLKKLEKMDHDQPVILGH
uniref:C-C motif chemokine n=1 Tax=Salarias fasciatus TaxID=181472 RepID=A0A672H3Y9_SALFA